MVSDYYNYYYQSPKPCPSCGHCPTCGRGGWSGQPIWITPYWQYTNPMPTTVPIWDTITITNTTNE